MLAKKSLHKKGPASVCSESEQKDHFLIFETYTDFSSEYRMNKTRLNEKEYFDFVKSMPYESV